MREEESLSKLGEVPAGLAAKTAELRRIGGELPEVTADLEVLAARARLLLGSLAAAARILPEVTADLEVLAARARLLLGSLAAAARELPEVTS